jgi:hypothetical protein
MLPRVPTAPFATRGKELLEKHATEIESNSSTKGKESGMTLKAKRTESLEIHPSPVQPHAEDTSANHAISHDDIRRRAYEIYVERGGLPGREVEDWLQAESEFESAALFIRAATGEKHSP